MRIAECSNILCKDNANERNESSFKLPSAAISYAKINIIFVIIAIWVEILSVSLFSMVR